MIDVQTSEVFDLRFECILVRNVEQNPHNEYAKETSEVFEKKRACCLSDSLGQHAFQVPSSAARLSY